MNCEACCDTGLIEMLTIETKKTDNKEFHRLRRDTFACSCFEGTQINSVNHYHGKKDSDFYNHSPFTVKHTTYTWKQISDMNNETAREYREMMKEVKV